MPKTRLHFLRFDASILALKASLWIGSIMALGTAAEYIGLTFFLEGEFDLNLKGRLIAFAIMATFTSALFISSAAVAESEKESADLGAKSNGD